MVFATQLYLRPIKNIYISCNCKVHTKWQFLVLIHIPYLIVSDKLQLLLRAHYIDFYWYKKYLNNCIKFIREYKSEFQFFYYMAVDSWSSLENK